MPRDSNGVYSLPAGNPVAAGTLVEADWANTTMQDIEDALNDILTTDGAVSDPIEFPAGSETGPSVTFVNETTTGIYHYAEGDVRITVLGEDILRITDEGVWVYNETTGQWEQLLSGSDLDDAESVNQSTSVPEKFRVYFLKFTGEAIDLDTTTVALTQIRIYKRGGGFINGERWSDGDLISLSATQLDDLSHSGGSTPPGGLDTLFDGTSTVAWSATGTRTGERKSIVLRIDFGEGLEERITGIEFDTGSGHDPLYSVEVHATNEGDITVGDFDAETWTGTVYRLGMWSTDEEGNAAIGTVGTSASSPHLALPASNVSTTTFVNGASTGLREGGETLIPDSLPPLGHVESSGGGLWEFDTTVKTANFTAESGKYYFVDTLAADASVTMTMPASPSAGDVVCARQLSFESGETSYVIIVDPNGEDIETSAGVTAEISLPVNDADYPTEFSDTQPYAGFVYLGATQGWVCFMGAYRVVVL